MLILSRLVVVCSSSRSSSSSSSNSSSSSFVVVVVVVVEVVARLDKTHLLTKCACWPLLFSESLIRVLGFLPGLRRDLKTIFRPILILFLEYLV